MLLTKVMEGKIEDTMNAMISPLVLKAGDSQKMYDKIIALQMIGFHFSIVHLLARIFTCKIDHL